MGSDDSYGKIMLKHEYYAHMAPGILPVWCKVEHGGDPWLGRWNRTLQAACLNHSMGYGWQGLIRRDNQVNKGDQQDHH